MKVRGGRREGGQSGECRGKIRGIPPVAAKASSPQGLPVIHQKVHLLTKTSMKILKHKKEPFQKVLGFNGLGLDDKFAVYSTHSIFVTSASFLYICISEIKLRTVIWIFSRSSVLITEHFPGTSESPTFPNPILNLLSYPDTNSP